MVPVEPIGGKPPLPITATINVPLGIYSEPPPVEKPWLHGTELGPWARGSAVDLPLFIRNMRWLGRNTVRAMDMADVWFGGFLGL